MSNTLEEGTNQLQQTAKFGVVNEQLGGTGDTPKQRKVRINTEKVQIINPTKQEAKQNISLTAEKRTRNLILRGQESLMA